MTTSPVFHGRLILKATSSWALRTPNRFEFNLQKMEATSTKSEKNHKKPSTAKTDDGRSEQTKETKKLTRKLSPPSVRNAKQKWPAPGRPETKESPVAIGISENRRLTLKVDFENDVKQKKRECPFTIYTPKFE